MKKHIKHIQNNTSHKYFARLVKIPDADDNTKSKKCIALASDYEDNYESLVFIKQDENNNIQGIYVKSPENYELYTFA